MITRKVILIMLASCGILLISLAGPFYAKGIISDNGYFKLYAFGLLCFAIRMRMQHVCALDAMVLNIIFWLFLFNAFDELFSLTPAKPFKPYIASAIVIISSVYLYIRKCRNYRKDGGKQDTNY